MKKVVLFIIFAQFLFANGVGISVNGGSNKKSNKVKLTPKEHHVCHLLLVKMGMCKNYWFTKMNNKKYEKMKKKEKLKLL
jgi:hypothetical protein